MRNEQFIQTRLVEESKKLYQANFIFPSFSFISQGIETLGAFMDQKPLSAKAQSKKRFNLAVNELFPKHYTNINSDNWLYKQMRCNTSHLSSSGGFIDLRLQSTSKGKHLALEKGMRIFVLEELLEDFHQACYSIIELLESDQLKQKPMAHIKYTSM